jgi:branched-chain amino acid transport system permease protein
MLITLFVFLFAVVPQILPNQWLAFFNYTGITLISILGLGIVLGYAGQISLGQAAFAAVGGYTTAFLATRLGWTFWSILPIAIIASALAALLFALPAARVKGFYLAVTTLAAHFLIMWTIIHVPKITGGVSGMRVPLPSIGGIVIDTEKDFYFMIMPFVVVAVFLAKNLIRGRSGRAFIAIRDNEIAAEFVGVNVFYYKLIAFIIAGAFAGLGGALQAAYAGGVFPEAYTLMDSIWALGMVLVGGAGSIVGIIFGVVFFQILKQVVVIFTPAMGNLLGGATSLSAAPMVNLLYAVVITLFLILEPRGLYHRWQILKASVRLWPYRAV